MDDKPEISQDIVKKIPLGESLDSINPDLPEIAKGIVKHVGIEKPTVDVDVPFSPYDHTTSQLPVNPATAAFGGNYGGAPKEKVGFVEGVEANVQDKNSSWRLLHGGWDRAEDQLLSYKDPNFNPLKNQDSFLDVRPEYQPYLLQSENDENQAFRLQRIKHEQNLDDTVKNSSWMQWLSGSAIGIGTDLFTYIPIMSQMKFASMGKNAMQAIARAAPGAAAYGFGSSFAEEVDKINGNWKDALYDGAIRSVFGTALFSAGPALSLAADKLQLWQLKSYVSDAVNGIGYRLKVGEKGEVAGMEAYDMTPNGSAGADRVKLAQDKADSAFHKGGLFKVPYIGKAAEYAMSNSFIGSPAMSMLNSPFQTVRAVIDLAYDHGITTKGLVAGNAKPMTFFTRMGQVAADIRQEQNIFSALHAERNGIKSDSYVSQSLQKAGMYTKQKTLEKIESEIGDRPYVNYDQFSEEVQQVIHSGEQHENAAVNEAAGMFRKSMDKYYSAWREAYKLPEDWMPPRTAQAYLMRVYDTNYMNNNLNSWVNVISNELKVQDSLILEHSQPILDARRAIETHTEKHRALLESPNIYDNQVKAAKAASEALKIRKRVAEENLQNSIRSNPDLHLMAEDWNALSADEAKELIKLTKPRDIAQKRVEEIEQKIADVTNEAKTREAQALKSTTVKTAKSKLRQAAIGKEEAERIKLKAELDATKQELADEIASLQEKMQSGEINRRFYTQPKDSPVYVLRDPSERLKLRKTYHEQVGYRADEEEAHVFRQEHAKAYYQTIMNQTAEDTINQIMGKFTGNGSENHIKERTLMLPDHVLYDNKFMTKDVSAKVANYKMWLARRTHLQNTYRGLSIDGGFEPVIRQAQEEFDRKHTGLNNDKATLTEKLSNEGLSATEKKKLTKALEQTEIAIKQVTKDFNKGKMQISHAYQKMAGISKLGTRAKSVVAGIKSFNVFANLGFLPATMVTDLSANGLKQGLIPFIQSGVYPAISSLGGLLKTHDSEAFRGTAGAINLALHHIGNSTNSRQMDLSTNPTLNLGRIPAVLDKTAHFASNINLSTSIDNFLQRLTSAVAQSNVIMHLQAHADGKLSKGGQMWLNRYGIDPAKDGAKILKAFKKDGGGKTSLGGYQSNFWHWEDLESSNKVADAVFRSTHDTIISANALDSPIWLDENGGVGMLAPIIRGFKGWAFASLNRYLIPSLQQPDAQKLMGFALMTASAALVSPSRRLARGESPYKEDSTPTSIVAEILLDSPQFAWMNEALQDANLLSGGSLMGKLKNDKYRDRTRLGLLGPTASNSNKLFNFVTAMATGDMNQKDVMGMASMIPVVNSLYGYNASKHIIDSFGLPKQRSRP